jgi:hypothetical protein
MEPAMEAFSFWVPGPLPNLNDLLEARMKQGRAAAQHRRWNAYTDLKRKWEKAISTAVKAAHPPKFKSLVDLSFHWVERDRRRDKDNVAGGGKKLLLDSLVECGVIPGDGWKWIGNFIDEFSVDPSRPGVMVTIVPAETPEEEERDGSSD